MKEQLKQLFIHLQALIWRYEHKQQREPLVYFESFHGKQFSDNPRAIYEGLVANYPEVKVVWGVKKGYEAPFEAHHIPYVHRFSKEWYQAVGRASIWVTNTRTKTWIKKRPDTLYIETWHGTPLKRIGLDIEDVNIAGQSTADYHRSVREETALWDYLISPSPYASQIFKSAFHLRQDQLLEVGYPRNDQLVNTTTMSQANIKKQLGLDDDQRVILYAPTWRDNLVKEDHVYGFQFPFSLDRFLEQVDENTILLIRMHYLVKEAFDLTAYHGRVRDVSDYEDMGQLLQIADVLITDYSSSFFDYALLNRPMIFYMFDRQYYQEALRGTYFDVDDTLPGPIVETEEALFQLLSNPQALTLDASRMQAFQQRFNTYDKGRATDAVIDVIMKEIDGGQG